MIKNSITQYITRWCQLKLDLPRLSQKFCKNKAFWWYHLKTWTGSIITMRSVHENKTILIDSLENLRCPCNRHLKFLQKYPRFNEVIRKFELPLLSGAEIFTKRRQFCWIDLTNCTYYHELIFLLKKTVLMILLEILNWPCYQELTSLQN